jgi:hypothetical protein
MTHGHRDFTVCSCSSLPVLSAGVSGTSSPLAALTCSITAVMSGEPVIRSARANARRRIAASRHSCSGCSQAPRPGSFLAGSTVTVQSPFPPTATSRSSPTASSRFRQPTHVRTGPTGSSGLRRCAETEGSRWITAESTVILQANRNGCAGGRCRAHAPAGDYRSRTAPCAASGLGTGLWAGGASLRMSIRKPVSRAASRAF